MRRPAPTGDPYQRALAAFYRSRSREGSPLQPHLGMSGVVEHNGRKYVVLINTSHTLAIYRVKNDGLLRELKRWPKDLDPHKD
jgi:hypothetical protein